MLLTSGRVECTSPESVHSSLPFKTALALILAASKFGGTVDIEDTSDRELTNQLNCSNRRGGNGGVPLLLHCLQSANLSTRQEECESFLESLETVR